MPVPLVSRRRDLPRLAMGLAGLCLALGLAAAGALTSLAWGGPLFFLLAAGLVLTLVFGFTRYGILTLLLIVLAVFLLWPIALTVWGGFVDPQGRFTLAYILSVFHDPLMREGLGNSLLIAMLTTLASTAVSMPLALLASRYDFPGKTLATGLVLTPLILPPFVGAIGLRALLGRFGAVNALLMWVGWLRADQPGIDWLGGAGGGRFWGVVIMEALHLYPILYLNLTAALANLDPALDEAAENLGARRWRRFVRITLPLILPGLFAGGTIVFIWSFTELGTPLMFDFYKVTPVQVFWGIKEVADNPRPYALVVVMLAVAVGLYLLGRLALGGRAHEMQGKAAIAASVERLSGWRGWMGTAAFGLVTLLAVLPHLGVILSSFTANGQWYRSIVPRQWTLSHYQTALSHPLSMGAIGNSLLYAGAAMALCMLLGLAIAYLTVRGRLRGAWLLDGLAMLPLAVPGLVMAFGYVAMTLYFPLPQIAAALRGAGLGSLASLCQIMGRAPNPLMFLIVAYAIRRLPYIVRSAAAGLEQTSGELEQAALNLGASRTTAIRRVVAPLILANLIAGGILVFAFSMLEVSDSLILAQKPGYFPITKAIWVFYNRLGDGPYIASAMGVWGMVLLGVTLVGASVMMGRRLGAVFRI